MHELEVLAHLPKKWSSTKLYILSPIPIAV